MRISIQLSKSKREILQIQYQFWYFFNRHFKIYNFIIIKSVIMAHNT